MTQKQIFLFIFIIFTSTIFAQRGDKCINKRTFKDGTCKLESECPYVQEQAKQGISPTKCGYYLLTQLIVCCGDSAEEHDLSLPNIPKNEDKNVNIDSRLRKSEQKCDEYSRPVESAISSLASTADGKPILIKVPKCKFNGVGLIVGGTEAEPEEFPFMALVGFNTSNPPWKCGGTLISERFVVTAAHCTIVGQPTVVRLGELDLSTEDDSTHDYALSNVITHPNYSYPFNYNDIALLQTKDKITFTNFIRPACLHWRREINSDKALAVGFGKINFAAAETNKKLLKVSLDIFSNQHERCVKSFPPNNKDLPRGLVPGMLCAGVLKGGKDTCQGDSGGPLVVTNPGNRCKFYLVGVTSFGVLCGIRDFPAIYTRVPEYIDWIEKEVW